MPSGRYIVRNEYNWHYPPECRELRISWRDIEEWQRDHTKRAWQFRHGKLMFALLHTPSSLLAATHGSGDTSAVHHPPETESITVPYRDREHCTQQGKTRFPKYLTILNANTQNFHKHCSKHVVVSDYRRSGRMRLAPARFLVVHLSNTLL